MSQILDEFDQPTPVAISHCRKISSEDFDRESAETTKEALHDLMKHLEQRPQEFYDILRRKKADNLEMFQFVKVKVLKKFKDRYLENYFPEEQCRRDLDNLKQQIVSAFDYSQEGKNTGVRFSKRLAEKPCIQQPLCTSTPRNPASMPPPPPPPPPILSVNNGEEISPVVNQARLKPSVNGEAATPTGTFQHELKLIQSIRSVQPRRRLHERNAVNKSEELKRPRLHLIEQGDLKAAKSKLKNGKMRASQKENQIACSSEEDTFSMFNTKLLEKFKNARNSPGSYSPSGQINVSDSGFDSPY